MRRLLAATNPEEAIHSRCVSSHGFTVIIDLKERKDLMAFLTETRNNLLRIIDSSETRKPAPLSFSFYSLFPLYVEQTYFHASVFGPPPWLASKDFAEISHDKMNKAARNRICDALQAHLTNQEPYLIPTVVEMMPKDGTVLVRFNYLTKDVDEAPLRSLGQQIDPDSDFSQWDPKPERYQTVTVALAVIDKDRLSETQLADIAILLAKASAELVKLGRIDIECFEFINKYTNRRLDLSDIWMNARIHRDHARSCRI